jgi:hypothetical protein
VRTELFSRTGERVASDEAPVTLRAGQTVTAHQRLYVTEPVRWDVETPELYRARTTLVADEGAIDEAETSFGIRTLHPDPYRGLRVNGRTVKFRGACVHHDNGLLRAATIAQAEERRVRILKEAGSNAIRSAHNPLSPAILDTPDLDGEEIVQLYVHQRYGTSSRPVRELKGFARVSIAAGQTRTVEFELGPDQLRYRSAATRGYVQDATVLDLWAGGDSRAELSTTLEVTA